MRRLLATAAVAQQVDLHEPAAGGWKAGDTVPSELDEAMDRNAANETKSSDEVMFWKVRTSSADF